MHRAIERHHRAVPRRPRPGRSRRPSRASSSKAPAPIPNSPRSTARVEIALYDLAGKARGVPVSELLGGRVRDRIRLYGSAGMYMPPEAYAAEAAAIADLGIPRLQNAPRRWARNRIWKPSASCARPSAPIST